MNNEKFLYERKNYKTAPVKIWFSFPAIESFGLASLGFLSLFKSLDENENVFVEKIFTDTQKTELSPKNLDGIGFSVSFEFDFLNIFKILEKHNIPFLAKERDENFPLLFAGGPVMSANPEPFCEFFDFIMLGDGEEKFNKVVEIFKNNKNLSKQELLNLFSQQEGFYVPSLTKYNPQTRKVSAIDGSDFVVKKSFYNLKNCIHTTILSEKSYFKNTFIIEIERGCPQRCGFCLASYLNYPVRFLPFEEIIKMIDFGLKYTDKLALLGAGVALHPDFEKICQYLSEKIKLNNNIEFSVSSLRADSVSPKIVQTLVEAGQKTATIAIEAGSERLRKIINKNLTEAQIFETVKTAYENGLKGLKIYAMIGLPTETTNDLDEMINLINRLKKQFKGFNLSLSFATFVPKAQTPFQFCSRENSKSLEKKYQYLQKKFHQIGIKINCSSVNWDYWQALISRGDRQLSQYLINIFKAGGNIGAFKNEYKSLLKQNLLPNPDYYALNPIDTTISNPWDFIHSHFTKEALIKENQKLLTTEK